MEDTLALHHDQHNFNRFFFSRRRVIFPYRTCGVIFHHNHFSIVGECWHSDPCDATLMIAHQMCTGGPPALVSLWRSCFRRGGEPV